MGRLSLKPTHKPVKVYYEALKGFKSANISHETAVRSAFQELLTHCCRQVDWKLIPEFSIKRAQQNPIRVDGALLDEFELPRGYWEAKDSHDDLEEEVDKKFKLGYPKDNILFQAPERAILWQKNKLVLDEDITKPDRLVETLQELFSYRQPVVMRWEEAAIEFKEKIPELAKGLLARRSGSSTSIKSAPTNGAASPTTPTVRMIRNILCGLSVRSLQSAWRR